MNQVINVHQPVSNQVLVERMNALKESQTNGTEKIFFDELLLAKLLVPVVQNSNISLINITDTDGMSFIPAFTDWNELKLWNSDSNQKGLIIDISTLKDIIAKSDELYGIVINPMGQNLVLNREVLVKVDSGETDEIQNGESVFIGVPEKYPHILVDRLISIVSNIDDVKKMYFLQMVRNKSDMSYLVVLESISNNNYQDIFEEIDNCLSNYLSEKEVVDFVPLDTEFGRNSVEVQEPIYVK